MFRDIRHSLPVRSVGADEQSVLRTCYAGQNRLYAKSSAALHQNRSVVLLRYMSEFQKPCTDLLGDFFIIVIPCAVVKQHFLFYGIRGSQRPRRKKFICFHLCFLFSCFSFPFFFSCFRRRAFPCAAYSFMPALSYLHASDSS